MAYCVSPCARAISTITVATAPGPDRMGKASGKSEMSGLSAPSRCSSGVVRWRDGCARTMSTDKSRSSTPPAMRNEPSEMLKNRRMNTPEAANTARITNIDSDARNAVRRLCSLGSLAVIAR